MRLASCWSEISIGLVPLSCHFNRARGLIVILIKNAKWGKNEGNYLSFGHTSEAGLDVGHVLLQHFCLNTTSSSGAGGVCPKIIRQLMSSKLGSIVNGILPTCPKINLLRSKCHNRLHPNKQPLVLQGIVFLMGGKFTQALWWKNTGWASCKNSHKDLCTHLFRGNGISLFGRRFSRFCPSPSPPLPEYHHRVHLNNQTPSGGINRSNYLDGHICYGSFHIANCTMCDHIAFFCLRLQSDLLCHNTSWH